MLRSSLTLSLLSRLPFRIGRIRAGRARPGLRRQHLAAVRAAAAVGDADVTGAELGSEAITFVPHGLRAGDHRFSTGGAGSATLVLQTVLLPLLRAESSSTVVVEGGTHNAWAPPFEFLERAYLPLLRQTGARLEVALERHGFHPVGGGRIRAVISPSPDPAPLRLLERGPTRERTARAVVSDLPRHIAEREVSIAQAMLRLREDATEVVEVAEPAGPGNAVMLILESARVTEVFTGFGRKGTPAEEVAMEACREALSYLESGVPVGPHLADQLVLPLASAGRGAYRTGEPSSHLRTNLAVARRFLELPLTLRKEPEGRVWRVRAGG